MNWYKEKTTGPLSKFSAAKDKIRRFNVTDPILNVFIQQYENIVDWNQVSNQEDIQNYIYDNLIPGVVSKIERDSDDNAYIKDIDLEEEVNKVRNDPEMRNHPQYQQLQQALAYYEMDPEGARRQTIDGINKNKEEAFDEWWSYVSEGNDTYKENPAWMYMVMSAVIKSSPESSKDIPVVLNAEALSKVFYDMSESQSPVNFLNLYNKTKVEVDKNNSEFTPTDDSGASGWIYIPGENQDPANYKNNIKKLVGLSAGCSWCTGAGAAPSLLKQGNFWVFVEGGRARAVIRTIDEGGSERGAELQGVGNKVPLEYAQHIFQLMESRPDISWEGSMNYKPLKEKYDSINEVADINEEEPIGSVETEEELTDDFEGDQPRVAKVISNWYKRAQAQAARPSSYYDIAHVGWNFSPSANETQQDIEAMWIIDENWNIHESSTGIAEAQKDGVENPFTGTNHGNTWPDMALTDISKNISRENYMARGRYERNEKGEKVSAILPWKIEKLSLDHLKEKTYYNIKKRIDKELKMKYPNAELHWYK